MTTPHDVAPVSESLAFSSTPASERRAEAELADLAQEINARRARVENAELLQHLRGL
ncbi:MAG: hypothetical protein ACXWKR_05100 [Phenylobacterium sp.]